MTLRQYLAAMAIGAGLAWTAIGIIIFRVSQPEASALVVLFLYSAFFIAALCTFAVFGFLLRAGLLRKNFQLATQVAVSFRQAALLAALVVVTLFLSSEGRLTWWGILLLVLGLSLVEAVIISIKPRPAGHK